MVTDGHYAALRTSLTPGEDKPKLGVNNVIFQVDAGFRASLVSARVSRDGDIVIRVPSGANLQIIVDIQGWFAHPAPAEELAPGGDGDVDVPLTPEEQQASDAKMAMVDAFAAAAEGGSTETYESQRLSFNQGFGADYVPCSPDNPCVPTSKSLSLTQVGQQTSYWCGPSTAYAIVKQLRTHGKISTTNSRYGSRPSLSQRNIATATYLNANDGNGTQRADMARGLNRWIKGSNTGPFVVKSTPTPTQVKNIVVANIYSNYAVAVAAYEAADGYHYNNHPESKTVDHWVSAYGYTSSGGTTRFADSATTVYAGVQPYFTFSTSTFTTRWIQPSKAVVY